MKDINIFSGKEIKNIDIVFENCETYTVPADGIQRMFVDDIRFSFDIHVNGLTKWSKPGEMMGFASANYVSLILNKKGMAIESNWKEMFKEDEKVTLAQRLKFRDITHFDFNFTDGTNFYMGVDWEDDENEFTNKYQHNDIKENLIFIDIYKDYNEEEEKKSNDDYDEFFSIDKEDIEVLDEETFNESVPYYVRAALSLIKERLDIAMWNSTQKEYDSPFGNTGNNFSNETFEVAAYNWNEEEDQAYNFKWRDYKIRWYKYFGRGMNSNRYISPEECAKMLDEIIKSLDKIGVEEEDII